MNKEILGGYGIDYDRGLINCMGSEDFYQMLLGMFLKDESFSRAKEAYRIRDYKEMFNSIHELKGVSGNAALSMLYDTLVPLLEFLRGGTNNDAEVDRMFSAVEAVYHRTCEGIACAIT